MNATGPKVFISYRREETAGHAGRLYDAVAARFGDRNVFMDVDLTPGIDFVEQITEAVGACDVLLVVMGPSWATRLDDRGRPRIANPDDFVSLEVETALRRPDVTVIPLLVAGARMPDPDELPERVRALARRNALELSDLRWRYDVRRLVSTLVQLLEGPTAASEDPDDDAPAAAKPTRRHRLPLAAAAAAVAASALAAAFAFGGGGGGGEGAHSAHAATLIPAGHRLVAQRSLAPRDSLRYTLALSVPKESAAVPLTLSLLGARGRESLRVVERKPLPDRYRFAKRSYLTHFRLDSNADGSGNVALSWFVDPDVPSTEVTCYLDVGLSGITYDGCS